MCRIKLEVDAKTDVGQVKKVNQDNILVRVGELSGTEFGLFIICDGVGGLDAGELASYTAVKIFNDWWNTEFYKTLSPRREVNIINELNQLLFKANEEILKISAERKAKIGTTASVLLIIGENYYISHIGDSRIYLYSKNKIKQLTEDHSLVNMQIKSGRITAKEAKMSKQKNILLQCLGSSKDIEIYNTCGTINYSNTFLLCCDGFYNKLEDKELVKLSKQFRKEDNNELLKKYIDLVKLRGERDNISIITVNCNSRDGKSLENNFLSKLFKF